MVNRDLKAWARQISTLVNLIKKAVYVASLINANFVEVIITAIILPGASLNHTTVKNFNYRLKKQTLPRA